MKPAIVERDIQRLAIEIRDAHRAVVDASKRVETARDFAARRRLELGHLLMSARPRWPRSGPKAKGWGELLALAGIDHDVALDAMKYAGYVEESSPGTVPEELPTRREAGLDDRPLAAAERPNLTLVPPALEVVDGMPSDRDINPENVIVVEPDRNAWCTPKWLADALGKFDLDPCSNSRSHIKSTYAFDLELRGENGLDLAHEVPDKWRVFVNPPFGAGQVIEWIKAYSRTRFCFLVRGDLTTEWFDELDDATQVMARFRRKKVPQGQSPRIAFEPPPGVVASSPDQNHVLMYAHEEDVSAAIRKMCRLYRKVT